MVLTRASLLVVPTTGNKPAEQYPFQDDAQAIPPTKRRRLGTGVVTPEVRKQLQGIGYTLFRNHNALGVVVANLESGQKASEMPTVNEHGNVVSLEK
jgi:hypothetical protein